MWDTSEESSPVHIGVDAGAGADFSINIREDLGQVDIKIPPRYEANFVKVRDALHAEIFAMFHGKKLTKETLSDINAAVQAKLRNYIEKGLVTEHPLPKKLDVRTLAINDYVLFESMDDLWGLPWGHTACHGDKRYFRVLKVGGGYVLLKNGPHFISLQNKYMSDDNIFTVHAQFPAIAHDWHLKISFPSAKDLPWSLRFRRRLANMFRRSHGKSV